MFLRSYKTRNIPIRIYRVPPTYIGVHVLCVNAVYTCTLYYISVCLYIIHGCEYNNNNKSASAYGRVLYLYGERDKRIRRTGRSGTHGWSGVGG